MLTFLTLVLLGVAGLASGRSGDTFDMAIIDAEPEHTVTETPEDYDVIQSDTDDLEHRYGKKIAFSAYLGSDLKRLGKRQHIKFDRVFLNDGKGYNQYTGVFRAPYSGVYSFTIVVGQRGAQEMTVRLVEEGRTIITAVAEGTRCRHDTQGSNTVIMRVRKGKALWVETMYGSQIEGATHGDRPTTFSGFLLY